MKIVNKNPPQLKELEALGLKMSHEEILTIGDTIYNPLGLELRDDLIVHESVHSKQQKKLGKDPMVYCRKYLSEPDFMLECEAEAYAVQLQYIANTKGVEDFTKATVAFSRFLASPSYKSLVTEEEAFKLIQKYL